MIAHIRVLTEAEWKVVSDVLRDLEEGGVLTTEQIFERDRRVFKLCKKHNVPVAWNLAGGYQVEPDGSIPKVLEIHLNTFRAAAEVYGG